MQKKNIRWYTFFLVGITLLVYVQGIYFNFTNWDDTQYILKNDWIRNWDAQLFLKAFTETHFGHYHPFTWLSLAVDAALFNYNPMGFHLHNLLLHIVNTLLVFFLLRKITNNASLSVLVTLAFTLHPFVNESVQWITERKNLLFTMFYLLSMLFYVKYLKEGKLKILSVSFVFFFFSLI